MTSVDQAELAAEQAAEVPAPNPKRARKPRAVKPPKAPTAPKPGRRQYGAAEDGTPIVSVTEVLQHLGWKTPGLMRWAAGLAAQACADAMAGGASYVDAVEAAKRAPFARRDEAAEAGTLAHAMAEALVGGRDPEEALDAFAPAEVQEGARRAFDRFASWWRDCGYSLVLSEEQLVDRAAGWGGTLDLLLRDGDGALVIADIKSSKDVRPDVVAQLAGYALLLRTQRGLEVARGLVINVPAEEAGEVQIVGVPADVLNAGERVFLACLEIHRAKAGVKLAKGVAA